MKRRDKVLEFLVEKNVNGEDVGLSALMIADALNLQRHNVSSDLNELLRDNLVAKGNNRPVKYWINQETLDKINSLQSVDPFENLIGRDGSLSKAVESAMASIVYPPNGLNTLLTGDSGVGKSYMAELMYQFAIETKTISKGSPFIVFNCADYASNPQLLLSHLFGYKKGSFTGAESDSRGIISRADGGILFLDEVHRLPPEGQEMLFLLIDKGYYTMLGNNYDSIHVNVRIIAATSENPKQHLLTTFLRRFPTLIYIPSLSERPKIEKLQVIKYYFQQEVNHLGVSLSVSPIVLSTLLAYETPGNVGELRSIIRLSCAKAFLNFISSARVTDLIQIFITNLPNTVQLVYFQESESVHEAEMLVGYENLIFVQSNDPKKDFIEYKRILEKHHFESIIETYLNSGLNYQEIEKLMKMEIDNSVQQLNRENYAENNIDKNTDINIDMQNFLINLKKELKCSFNEEINNLLYYYLSQIKENINNDFKSLFTTKKNSTEFINNNVYIAVKKYAYFLEKSFGRRQLSFIQLITISFFVTFFKKSEEKHNNITIFVICHGDATATSIVNVSRNLIGYDSIFPLDMPLNQTIQKSYSQLLQIIKTKKGISSILLMVDMGSLKDFKYNIEKDTSIPVSLVDLVTTLTVLEACKLAKYDENISPAKIAQQIAKSFKVNFLEEQETQNKVILTSCLTGKGTSRRLMVYLTEYLKQHNYYDIKVLSIDSLINNPISIEKQNKVIAVIGTVNPHLDNIPFIGIEKILLGSGVKLLHHLIENDTGKMVEYINETTINSIDEAKSLSQQFVYENTDTSFRDAILDCVNRTLKKLEQNIGSILSPNQVSRFIIHYAFSIERLFQNEPITECNELINIKKNHFDLFNLMKHITEETLPKSLNITEEELCYLVMIFT